MNWNEIKENPYYLISDSGLVMSIDRKYHKGRTLKPRLRKNGYYYVSLSFDSKVKDVPIHRLVAKAFIANPKNKRCVNHKDGDKLNNNKNNLEWVTHKENHKHASINGLNNWGEKQGLSKLSKQDIKEIRALYSTKFYNQPELAQKYRVTQPNISAIINNKTWRQDL